MSAQNTFITKKIFDLVEIPIPIGTKIWTQGRLSIDKGSAELWICSEESQQKVNRALTQDEWNSYFETP